MKSFSTQDLHRGMGESIYHARTDEFSIMAEQNRPLFAVRPLDGKPPMGGFGLTPACRLYKEGDSSLGKAARLAGVCVETLIEHLGAMRIPVVDYPVEELDEELKILSS